MKKLTVEQKAKRYEWFEKAIKEHYDELIEQDHYNKVKEEQTPCSEIVEDWIDKIDRQDDIFPQKVMLLIDKIASEEFTYFVSLKNCAHEPTRQEYAEFEKAIGE